MWTLNVMNMTGSCRDRLRTVDLARDDLQVLQVCVCALLFHPLSLRVDRDDFASATTNHHHAFKAFSEHFQEFHIWKEQNFVS